MRTWIILKNGELIEKSSYAILSPSIFFEDAWRTNGEDKTFFSSAFTESLIVRPKQNNTLPRIDSNKVLRFSIDAPRIGKDLCFCHHRKHKTVG